MVASKGTLSALTELLWLRNALFWLHPKHSQDFFKESHFFIITFTDYRSNPESSNIILRPLKAFWFLKASNITLVASRALLRPLQHSQKLINTLSSSMNTLISSSTLSWGLSITLTSLSELSLHVEAFWRHFWRIYKTLVASISTVTASTALSRSLQSLKHHLQAISPRL
jgi:hypothetical protein